eukprot:scaffold17492_cov23-Tisochrysis_lutea.AAC.2
MCFLPRKQEEDKWPGLSISSAARMRAPTRTHTLPFHTQAGQVAQLVASRLLIPIFVCSTSLGVAGGTGDVQVAATVAAVLLAFLTPIPPQLRSQPCASVLTQAGNMCLRGFGTSLCRLRGAGTIVSE